MSEHGLFRCDVDGCTAEAVVDLVGTWSPDDWDTKVLLNGRMGHVCPKHRTQRSRFKEANERYGMAREKAIRTLAEPYDKLLKAKVNAWEAVNPAPKFEDFKPADGDS